jgi:hypothetical protein
MVRRLARHRHGSRLADDDRWYHPHCRAADRSYDQFEHLRRSRANTIVAALIIGALGAFLSFKGCVRRA